MPDGGDIYGILKFLAEADAVRSKAEVYPEEANSFQVVFSLWEENARESGWHDARWLGRAIVKQ